MKVVLFLLLSACALPAGAESRPLRGRVAIDIGHSPAKGGAISARGTSEYLFNRAVALALERELEKMQLRPVGILDLDREVPLRDRVAAAELRRADILVFIHHDSAQEQFLKPWSYAGQNLRYCDRFSGFSLFVSGKIPRAGESLSLAGAIGDRLLQAGFHPTLHHAQDVPGERRTLLDPARGIYRYDQLAILKSKTMVTVLVECGVIVSPDEEAMLEQPEVQQKIARAIASGILTFLGGR
nr:N-acetylmuramoyl-L-alanine amidase [Geomonas sp. Red32]